MMRLTVIARCIILLGIYISQTNCIPSDVKTNTEKLSNIYNPEKTVAHPQIASDVQSAMADVMNGSTQIMIDAVTEAAKPSVDVPKDMYNAGSEIAKAGLQVSGSVITASTNTFGQGVMAGGKLMEMMANVVKPFVPANIAIPIAETVADRIKGVGQGVIIAGDVGNKILKEDGGGTVDEINEHVKGASDRFKTGIDVAAQFPKDVMSAASSFLSQKAA